MRTLYYVYVITCLANGKVYVGKTHDVRRRCLQHIGAAVRGSDYILARAIRKYGVENFAVEIVECSEGEATALVAEREWVTKLKSNQLEVGYNMTDGGDGVVGTTNSEMRARRSRAAVKRGVSWITIEASVKARKGKPLSPEHKAKIGRAGIGRPKKLGEVDRIRQKLMGHTVSEETRARIRASCARARAEGRGRMTPEGRARHAEALRNRPPPLPISEETRSKMRKAKAGRTLPLSQRQKIGKAAKRSAERKRLQGLCPNGKPLISDNQRERVRELRHAGLTLETIGQIVQLSPASVCKILKEGEHK